MKSLVVSEKIAGYVLLGVGIIIILFVAVNVMRVFTGSSMPYQFIKDGASLNINLGVPGESGDTGGNVPVTIGNISQVIQIVNYVLYVVFAGFFAGVGFKLAMIGANLVRPIVVKANPDAPKINITPKI